MSADADVETGLPTLSVLVPCLDAVDLLKPYIHAILANSYPVGRLEILVIDGGSRDGSREIVQGLARQNPRIRLLENPFRTAVSALNIGIRASKGDYILRVDTQARLAHDYLRNCLRVIEERNADNVGGIPRPLPRTESAIGRAIACALSHPLGTGNSAYRSPTRAGRWVETVYAGFYPRDVFKKMGLFNEKNISHEDFEFNVKLTRAGGRIWQDPAIRVDYFARSTVKALFLHKLRDGCWSVLGSATAGIITFRARHVAPLILFLSLLAFALAAPAIAMILIGSYFLAGVISGALASFRRKDPWLVLTLPLVFTVMHGAYALGNMRGFFLWGLGRFRMRT